MGSHEQRVHNLFKTKLAVRRYTHFALTARRTPPRLSPPRTFDPPRTRSEWTSSAAARDRVAAHIVPLGNYLELKISARPRLGTEIRSAALQNLLWGFL